MTYPKFVKYERIPHIWEIPELLDREIEVYEKLDGGNAQVRKAKGRVLAGNRSKFLTDKIKGFPWFQDFLKWASGNYSFYNLPENKIVFGEWLSKHTLDYFPDKMNRFYFFDLFDMNSQRFIPYKDAVKILEDLEVKEVGFLRPLFRGKIDMLSLEKLVGKSDYRDGDAEGLVIKNYRSQQFAKLWAGSVNRKKRILLNKDIRKTIISMIESGTEITSEHVVKEIIGDFSGQRIPYSKETIERAINNYFFDTENVL